MSEQDLTALRAQNEELRAALRLAQGGCGSLIWLANNKHNVRHDPIRFVEFLERAESDAQRGYDAAAKALGAIGRAPSTLG